MIDKATLVFLSEAAANFRTDWLEENRDRLARARSNLVDFAAQLISGAGSIDSRVRDANPIHESASLRPQFQRAVGPSFFELRYRKMPRQRTP
jgi:hypothetical protein